MKTGLEDSKAYFRTKVNQEGLRKTRIHSGTANEVLCSSEAGIEEGVITNPSRQKGN
jgi:hypothetical protein